MSWERPSVPPVSERGDDRPPFWLRWGPVLVAMAAIFAASSVPNLTRIPGNVSDKVAHFVGYAVLGVLALRAVSGVRWRGVTLRSALVAWGVCVVYGATDEFHQWFVPGRSTSLDDWIADAAGAAVAIGLVLVAARGLRGEPREV